MRGVIRRGRALTEGLGEDAGVDKLMPEVTITADGVFWSPFAPTVTEGRLDTDLLIARGTRSLEGGGHRRARHDRRHRVRGSNR